MQREVMNDTLGGPLASDAEDAGRGCHGQLQRAITKQREDCWQRQLHSLIMALPAEDMRRRIHFGKQHVYAARGLHAHR